MVRLAWLVALSTLLQTGQSSSPPAAAAQAVKPAPIDVHVTDRTGRLLDNAHVSAEGPVSRDGVTDQNGTIVFQNLTTGTYRFRIERAGFFTLEKEAAIRTGTAATVQAALSAAPPPPPPPAPAPVVTAPPPPVFVAGMPKVLSVLDLLVPLGKDPIRTDDLGCSGAVTSRFIRAADAVATHSHADADETLYLVTGDARLTLGDKTYPLKAGSFALVPRGVEHALARTGKNPFALLSTLSGPVCGKQQ